MARPILAITRAVPHAFLEQLSGFEFELRLHHSVEPLRDGLADFLDGAQATILAPYDRIDAALLARCKSLRIVANASAGFDNLDLPACTAQGVLCTNAPDGVTGSTADFAIGLMISAARRIVEADALVRRGGWSSSTYESFMSPAIEGGTLGILGMGRIGQAITRRAARGFGMQVLYWSRTRLPTAQERELSCSWREKGNLLAQADHVIVALPYSDETRHAVGQAEFASMRPGATFVNIGRGGVVDDVALAAALEQGLLGGAALDVFEGEPALRPELLAAPRLVVTPHIASATLASRLATLQQALDNVRAAMDHRMPENLLNHNAVSPVPGSPSKVTFRREG